MFSTDTERGEPRYCWVEMKVLAPHLASSDKPCWGPFGASLQPGSSKYAFPTFIMAFADKNRGCSILYDV